MEEVVDDVEVSNRSVATPHLLESMSHGKPANLGLALCKV